MAANNTGARYRGYNNGRNYYTTEGNTARQLDVRHAIKEEPRKKLSHTARKNRDRAHHMNFGYVAFLSLALFVAGYVLIGYIQLQADITTQTQTIAAMESKLYNMQLENDGTLVRINSSIDLEEIKRIAIGELGMVYASEGQIVNFTNEGNDYVRQLADIPR